MRAIRTTAIVSDPSLNGQIGRSLVSSAAIAPEASIRQRDVSVDGVDPQLGHARRRWLIEVELIVVTLVLVRAKLVHLRVFVRGEWWSKSRMTRARDGA
jgi:hypothetical protein